jgi:hypothetical protein
MGIADGAGVVSNTECMLLSVFIKIDCDRTSNAREPQVAGF